MAVILAKKSEEDNHKIRTDYFSKALERAIAAVKTPSAKEGPKRCKQKSESRESTKTTPRRGGIT